MTITSVSNNPQTNTEQNTDVDGLCDKLKEKNKHQILTKPIQLPQDIETDKKLELKSYNNIVREIVLKYAHPMSFVTEIPKTTCNGVWYMTPEYHVIESCIMVGIAVIILFLTNSMIPEIQSLNTKGNNTIFEVIMRNLLTVDFAIHIYFKSYSSPKGKGLWWLLQPCSINHCLILFLLYHPQFFNSANLQYLITLTCGAANAILHPDTEDSDKFIPYSHFWFQHLSIYLLPHYWLIKHLNIMQQSFSIWYSFRAHSFAMLYQFIILEICSISTGVNINYCLSPPNAKILTKHGKKYRIVMTIIMLFGHLISGYLIPKILFFIISIHSKL